LRGVTREAAVFKAFTTTFEDLRRAGLRQLPGIAVQRLMADGYGFAAEGDWKTAALVRHHEGDERRARGRHLVHGGLHYHLGPDDPKVLGAHMLEVCPSISGARPSCEIHPLSIGGREDPVRLVFTARPGRPSSSRLLDLGNRFRLVANEVDVVRPSEELPRCPSRARSGARSRASPPPRRVARGGRPHHTSFTQALTSRRSPTWRRSPASSSS
jgi:L-arabinose isomerase